MSKSAVIESQKLVIHNLPEKKRKIKGKSCCSWYICGRVMEPILYIFGVLLILQAWLISPTFEDQFNREFAERFILSPNDINTTNWNNWVENTCNDECGIQNFSFYIYNITNPNEFLNGNLPILNEIGPFIYLRYELKRDISFIDDDTKLEYTIEYEYEYTYNNTEYNYTHDTVTIVNPYWLFLLINQNGYARQFVDDFFIETTIEDIIFNGIPVKFTGLGSNIIENQFRDNNASFKCINDSSAKIIEYTGNINDTSKMRELIMIFGRESFDDIWESNELVNPAREPKQWPFLTINRNDPLNVWSYDKYRQTNYVYDSDVEEEGLTMWKYRMSNDVFTKNDNYYMSIDGLINITSMTGTFVPTFTSKAHFMDANDSIIQDSINMGIRPPDPSIDDIYLYIEPQAGTVFRNYLTNQVNFKIEPVSWVFVNVLANLPEIYLPVYYFIVNAYAPAQAIQNYRVALDTVNTITQVSIYGGPTFGVICLCIATWLIVRRKTKKRLFDDVIDETEQQWYYDARKDNNLITSDNDNYGSTPIKLKSRKNIIGDMTIESDIDIDSSDDNDNYLDNTLSSNKSRKKKMTIFDYNDNEFEQLMNDAEQEWKLQHSIDAPQYNEDIFSKLFKKQVHQSKSNLLQKNQYKRAHNRNRSKTSHGFNLKNDTEMTRSDLGYYDDMAYYNYDQSTNNNNNNNNEASLDKTIHRRSTDPGNK